MRFLKPPIIFIAAVCVTTNSLAQSVRRDPSAIQFLSQVASSAGGRGALAAVQDFTATGTLTVSGGTSPQQGPVTIKGLGLTQFRLDSTLPQGTLSLIVSNGSGEMVLPDGAKSHLSYQEVVNLGALTNPLLRVTAALLNPSTVVLDMGIVQIKGAQVRQIRIQQTFPSDPTGVFSQLATQDYFFDPTTTLLVETQDFVRPQNMASPRPLLHVVDFAEYTAVGGLKLPFSVSEAIEGQPVRQFQLSSVSFNGGLTNSDFLF